MRTFCDLQGQETGLGRCLGQGGEGAVYSVPNWPSTVAKIYARRPDEHAARKLGAMVQLATEELASVAAWPQNLLLEPRTGAVVGFLMPRLDDHREIHKLYGPTDRKAAFPDATWAFLVRAARNLAAAFDVVHRHGHVIGDVNQGNVVVSRQATVRLIDCDSFQISHLGRLYPCRVGVPLFTPPELAGRKLDGVERTPEHDRFGLAVLVFQLLFMGRHPYAGRHPKLALPVEAALKQGLFAFGCEAARSGFEPPPFSLWLKEATAPVAELFERAFSRAATLGGPRPAAADWVRTLETLEQGLVTCRDDPRHAHPRGAACPWCRIELDGGPSFFFLPPGAAPDAFDPVATWRSIEAVPSPGFAPPPVPPTSARRGLEGLATAALRTLHGLLGDVVLRRSPRWRDEVARESRAIDACLASLRKLETQWIELCGTGPFAAKRRDLEEARAALAGLDAAQKAEAEELEGRYREKRLPPYLAGFELEFARIPGLGPAELARLASRGIKTAADVSPETLMTLRGIDLELVKALLQWRSAAARAFPFDPVAGIPGRERRALAERQAQRRGELLKKLQSGALELAEIRRQTLAWREVVGRGIREQGQALAELRAHAVWTRAGETPPPVHAAVTQPAIPGSAGSSAPSAGR